MSTQPVAGKECSAVGADQHTFTAYPNRATRLGQIHGQPLLKQGRGHHEDHEQDQHHVDERHDVDLGQGADDTRRTTPMSGPYARTVSLISSLNLRHGRPPAGDAPT